MPKSMMPSDFEQYITVVRYELLGYLRKKRLWAIIAIVFMVFFLAFLLPPALGHDYPAAFRDYSQGYLGFVGILVLLCATFFGSDALVTEFQQKTGFVVFPNPVRRLVIGLGKFSASMIASVFVISIYYGLIALFVGGLYKEVNVELVYSFLIAIMYLSAVVGVAYFISSVMKGTVGSTLLTFFLFLLILPMVGGALMLADVEPWFLVTHGGDAITHVMDPGYTPGKECIMGGSMCFFLPDIYVSVAVMAVYLIVFLILAFFMFNRREMVG
ncbi:MAG: ABC transporter permease [Thermoplasmata archaeon]|nr:ABC transporter permease [Thermoplasmata archaeon]